VAATVVQPSAAFSAGLSPLGAASGPIRTVSAVPVVQSLTPAVGSVEGGTVVTVLGSGFLTLDPSDPDAVKFGDAPAERVVVVNDTRLAAVAPTGSYGTVQVTVANGNGPSVSRNASFGYRTPLTASFQSVATPVTGGAEIVVDVLGGNAGATAKDFAALPITALAGDLAAKVTWLNATQVKITLPASARLGPVRVRLVQGGFTGPQSDAVVTYVPAVTSITPARISTEGGTTVKIIGAGFKAVDPDDLNAVTFGGVPAPFFLVLSDTEIRAVAPEGDSGNAAVRVTAPSGSNVESSAAQVAYLGVLGVETSNGAFVRANGGRHVLKITGATLGDDARQFAASGISVRLGAAKLSATWVDSTHLAVNLPAQTGESVTLTLLNGTIGADVTLPVAPVITGLSVTADTVAGGKKVTVRTAGAATATGFRFGDAEATCTGTKGVYVCVVPPSAETGPVWVRFTSGTDVASGFTDAATFSYTDLD
jgi:hypothetical protein